jgi:hypothetical protein
LVIADWLRLAEDGPQLRIHVRVGKVTGPLG